jgi:protein-L-isoaspartate(D-aspartate) O-methyltransferase
MRPTPFQEPIAAREKMVAMQIAARGIRDERVLTALSTVPRHAFVAAELRHQAYEDFPLSIGHGQTISQPYMVALMTELAHVSPEAVVLEIGAGCGYQTAILAELAKMVYAIEIVAPLAEQARQILAALGYHNVELHCGDGYAGWPEHGPYDAILLAASPPEVPLPLLEQLKIGGRLVAPVGTGEGQVLNLYTKTAQGIEEHEILPVRFVPMTGVAQTRRK